MQNHGNRMFVGLKTNDKLRDQLDSSTTSMKPFFKDNNPEFLQVIQIDDTEYIGKAIESGASLESLGNIFRNVKTMIKMICPSFSVADDAIKILALPSLPSKAYC
jgi:hypothetical protein